MKYSELISFKPIVLISAITASIEDHPRMCGE